MLKMFKAGVLCCCFMTAVMCGVERAFEVKIGGGTYEEAKGTTTYLLTPMEPMIGVGSGYYRVVVECATFTERLIMVPTAPAVLHIDAAGGIRLILLGGQIIGEMSENVRFKIAFDDEQAGSEMIFADEPKLLQETVTVRRLSSSKGLISMTHRRGGPVVWVPVPHRIDGETIKRLSEGCDVRGIPGPVVTKEGNDSSDSAPSASPEEVPVYDAGEGCVTPYPSPEEEGAAPSVTATTTEVRTGSGDDAEQRPAVYNWDGRTLTRLMPLNAGSFRRGEEEAPGSDPLSRRSVQQVEERMDRVQEFTPRRTYSSLARSPSMDRLNERRRSKARSKERRAKESWRSDSEEGLIVPDSVLRPVTRVVEGDGTFEEPVQAAAAPRIEAAAAAPRAIPEDINATQQDDLPPPLRRLFNGNVAWQSDATEHKGDR